jgi:hypothetical protein
MLLNFAGARHLAEHLVAKMVEGSAVGPSRLPRRPDGSNTSGLPPSGVLHEIGPLCIHEGVTLLVHNRGMTSEPRGRIVGVIGTCSAGGCSRPAVRHVAFVTARGGVAGVVCERCASATSSAVFLLDLIA